MQAPIVRAARPADDDEVRDVIRRAYAEFARVVPEPLYDAYVANLVDLDERRDVAELLVAEADGAVVGTVTFYASAADEGFNWPDGWSGFRALAVDPARRGFGTGDLLVCACIDRTRALGAPELCLHTASFMEAAVHLYERHGFVRDETFDLKGEDMMNIEGVDGPLVIAYRLDLQR
jgi:predicted N-acetyltransferase YhbS